MPGIASRKATTPSPASTTMSRSLPRNHQKFADTSSLTCGSEIRMTSLPTSARVYQSTMSASVPGRRCRFAPWTVDSGTVWRGAGPDGSTVRFRYGSSVAWAVLVHGDLPLPVALDDHPGRPDGPLVGEL